VKFVRIKYFVAVLLNASILGSAVFANNHDDGTKSSSQKSSNASKISHTLKNTGGPAPGYGKKQIKGTHFGILYLPKNLSKPVPAVIFLHGGVGVDKRYKFHRKTMLEAGIATFELDLKKGIYEDYYSIPDTGRFESAGYTALKKLQSLSTIDPDRIAVMGFSLGGGIAVHLASKVVRDRYVEPGQSGFAAHVAFYPGCWWLFDAENSKASKKMCEELSPNCQFEGELVAKPLFILAGKSDSWGDGTLCNDFTDVLNHYSPGMAKTKIYPGAHHAFDLPGVNQTWVEKIYLGPHKGPHKATVRHSKKTASQSTKDAVDFLKEILF